MLITGSLAGHLLVWRDLEVLDEKANALTYAKTEAYLALLCVAEVVECVAEVCFFLTYVTFKSLADGNFLKKMKGFISMMKLGGLAISGSVISLFTNLFSEMVFPSTCKVILPLIGSKLTKEEIRLFSNIKEHKEELTEAYARASDWIRKLSVLA